ncbi:MAG: 2-oxoacid:acceptor oxidoreductase subunit alpha, partial [Candidatus Bipolaricaulia bacterium]
PMHSPTDRIDLLVSFDAETVVRHARDVVPEGGIIYDPKLTDTPLEKIPTLEAHAQATLGAYLEERKLDKTVGRMLEDAKQRGIRCFPIPYDELLNQLSEALGGVSFIILRKVINTLAVAASCRLLGYDIGFLEKALADVFRGKQKVIDMNVQASRITYEYASEELDPSDDFPYCLEPIETDEPQVYLNGNQAVALGKILAGCSFQSYYPISPATDESVYLEAHPTFPLNGDQEQGSILVVQTEDEIAAITMATSAALIGARAATSTSGPGFSLMAEGLGWAGMNEVPVVVTLYQRGGPSTGLPTRHEQGDLRFALHAGHGEFPRIILASGDLEECFYDAAQVFNYAERYQTPTIHLIDKALASTTQTYPIFNTDDVRIERGQLLSEAELENEDEYRRFRFTETGVSPRTIPGTRGGIFWNTGDEHDERGHITENPTLRSRMMEKRNRKLETAAVEIPSEEKWNLFGDPEAETIILSWGSTKGAILEAMERLSEEGHRLRFLQVRLLSPLPADDIREILGSAKRRIGIEMNLSAQFAGWVREKTGITMNYQVVKYNGRPISSDELYEALQMILSGDAPERIVLSRGV